MLIFQDHPRAKDKKAAHRHVPQPNHALPLRVIQNDRLWVIAKEWNVYLPDYSKCEDFSHLPQCWGDYPCQSSKWLPYMADCFLLQSYPSTLDLSTAFNTIDHDLVWKCLREYAFLLVSILKWFYSYPSDSWHHVSMAAHCSGAEVLEAGVQRGLMLIWAHRLPLGPVTATCSGSISWAA